MISEVDGPDFICIGMPKAGTDWLFDQLQYHPDFWMPPVKEIRYLLNEVPKLKNVHSHLARMKRPALRRPSKKRPGDERDRLFLEHAASLSGKPRDIEQYAGLFCYKHGKLSGDVSPAYCWLDETTVQGVASALPHTKIIFLIRDPVARAWSHLSMWHRTGKFDAGLLESPDKFRTFLGESKEMEQRSFASHTAMRWKRFAPEMKFHYFFLDDIAKEPAKTRREIMKVLGADPDRVSGDFAAGYNRKSQDVKLPLTAAIKGVLVAYFADEIRTCMELFGGHAEQWAANYGI